VKFAERGEGGERDRNEIADAADIENDLIGTFFEEAAAEKSDHRKKVLLCWLRVSTRTDSGGKVDTVRQAAQEGCHEGQRRRARRDSSPKNVRWRSVPHSADSACLPPSRIIATNSSF
jgi:hypothetical protein